jgi:hypothetical protein
MTPARVSGGSAKGAPAREAGVKRVGVGPHAHQ